MTRDRSEQEQDPVVAAIERVLKAERAAEVALQDCRERAEKLVAAARESAAAIARRTDQRISALHTGYLHKIDGEIADRFQRSKPSGGTVQLAMDDGRIARAVERLAAKLTEDG